MGKKLEGAIKGATASLPISVGYGLAGNPGGGLMAIGAGAILGATVGATRRNPTANRKSEFYDAHGKAVGIEGAMKWGEEVGKE